MAHEKKNMVTAVFRDRVNAQSAYDRLIARGYRNTDISVLMTDATRSAYFPPDRESGRISAGSHMEEGAAVGGAIGTAVGATLAAVAAVGTSLIIPGLGLVVAGPIAAALAGAGAGAVTGGLIGGLVGLGIPESNAEAYQQALKEGGVVLGVVPRSSDEVSAVKDIFEDLNGENIYPG
jgi:hypothetical protein